MYIECFTTIFVLVLGLVGWNMWNQRHGPPGPWNLPVVGYLPWLNPDKPYATLTQLSRIYGPLYALRMGSVYTVVLTDYKMIKKVFLQDSCAGRAPLYVTHGIMQGYGLICAEGDIWKDQRKFVMGCLRNFGAHKSSPKRENCEKLINTGVDELLKLLNEQVMPNKAIDPLSSLRHCIGNVVNAFVFGCTWSSDDAVWNWLQILQEEGTKHIGVGGPVNFLPLMRFIPKYKRTLNFLMEGKIKTHQVYNKLIKEHEKTLNVNSTTQDCKNIIDAFLVQRENRKTASDPSVEFYSDQQFYHLLADVFGASLDTTLTTLRWFLLFMAAYPHEQASVFEELESVLNGKRPALDDMTMLPFMQAAIAETQRIRSVVPLGIPHGTLEDTVIEGYSIPKGTMIVPLQWAIHMDPSYWVNPDLFNPRRFLDAEGRFFKPDCFIPFQTGKRICIGEDLAKMLLFLFSASLIQSFRISVPIDSTIDLSGDCGITLTPKKHSFVFTPRKNNNNIF